MSARWILAACALLFTLLAPDDAPAQLLLGELDARPGSGFIELHNTSTTTLSLERHFLTNVPDAYRLVNDAPSSYPGAFIVALPPLELAPDARFVIALDDPSVFEREHGHPPHVTLNQASGAVPVLAPAFDGAIGEGVWSREESGLLWLFTWDGASDRVEDVDYIAWGRNTALLDRSGVEIDGPDANDAPTAYHADTSEDQQWVMGAPAGRVLIRVDVSEDSEPDTGGNGARGQDETGEPWPRTWAWTRQATPGAPNRVAWRVSGVVTHADARPHPGVSVQLREAARFDVTDARGAFAFDAVPAGSHTLALSDDASAGQHFEAVLLDTRDVTLSLELAPGDWLFGRVTLAEGGDPRGIEARVLGMDLATETDGDGDFELGPLPSAHYQVQFARPGSRARVLAVRLEEGESARVDARLYPDAQTEVRVTSASGGWPAGTRLVLDGEDDLEWREEASPDGADRAFAAVPLGQYTLTIRAAGFRTWRAPLEVLGAEVVVWTPIPEEPPLETEVGCSFAPRAPRPSSPGGLPMAGLGLLAALRWRRCRRR